MKSRETREIDGVEVGWPRVKAGCEYLSPVRFGETLDIRKTL